MTDKTSLHLSLIQMIQDFLSEKRSAEEFVRVYEDSFYDHQEDLKGFSESLLRPLEIIHTYVTRFSDEEVYQSDPYILGSSDLKVKIQEQYEIIQKYLDQKAA